jgi:hypothetical protein
MADRVTVIYKSGAMMEFTADKFSLSRSPLTSELTAANWMNASPRPLLFGLDDVAAVFVEEAKRDA